MCQICRSLQYRLLSALLGHGLIDRVMPDEETFTLAQNMRVVVDTWVSHSVIAWDFDNVVPCWVVVPANILRECFLLVRPVLLPGTAAGVLLLVGALLPCRHHLKGVGQCLRDNNAGIKGEFAFAVVRSVLVAIENLARVERHGDRGLRCDAPAIEEPFDGQLQVLNCGVGVDKDDESVGV